MLLRLGIADETQVASSLEEVVAAVEGVAVGSYPVRSCRGLVWSSLA